MVSGGGGGEWKDIPAELLVRIVSLVGDDRTVIVASGVCSGWRDALSWGLTQLSLSWCNKEMNNLVLSFVCKFTKLRVLVLRQASPQLEDNAVEALSNRCRELRELDLRKSFKLTDRSLYALAHGCPNLLKLNISGCSAFTDAAIAYLSEHFTKLQVLNMCGCVKGATDFALKAIGYNCKRLRTVNLGWCDKVGDEGVMSLAYGCPELRALDLCGCVLITDDSVIALANNCPHLRSLDLYFCQNITDRAMYSLARKHKIWRSPPPPSSSMEVEEQKEGEEEGLMNLNISQCTALTPPAVQAVCVSSPALHTCPGRHSLIISGCLNLTSVHCACAALHAHRPHTALPPTC